MYLTKLNFCELAGDPGEKAQAPTYEIQYSIRIF